MKRILITGGSGFIGRSLLPLLRQGYSVEAPPRAALDTTDAAAVDAYLAANKFDILLHFASPNPGRTGLDGRESLLSDMLRGFANLRKHADKFDMFFYTGSGAEYDKTRDIKMMREEEIGQSVPQDDYGLGKYTLNALARASGNIYNLRIFGCYGPTDPKTKFIRDAIDCCLAGSPITIRQDCLFDYIYVDDLARIIMHFIEHKPKFHDYNACTGSPAALSEIAKIVSAQTGINKPAVIAKEGFNKEYTASNGRLMAELGDFKFTPPEEGIAKQIAWQKTLK
ncbi:MAG: NAD(P)-dependent oxidoreductase [Elusimicrobiota bacterium]|jgi:GDP-L-fucose synthase|nr:NAD(P)-dependent oxidoreductase [Elusimicrobiota bacterium]